MGCIIVCIVIVKKIDMFFVVLLGVNLIIG